MPKEGIGSFWQWGLYRSHDMSSALEQKALSGHSFTFHYRSMCKWLMSKPIRTDLYTDLLKRSPLSIDMQRGMHSYFKSTAV